MEALVLAAGAGARFGGGKLTHRWEGGALIDGALAGAFAAPARSVTVVIGADAGVEAAAGAFAAKIGAQGRLRIVRCPDHAEGMGATLRTGVASLPDDAAGVFVFLGDMPRVPAAILPRLVAALAGGTQAAAPAHRGQRGHPVLFAAALFPQLRRSRGDEGARAALKMLGERLTLVETEDDGVLFDVDRPGDLPRPA
jgi:molybdenum cofactor cytidylyltransferase